MLLTRRIHPGYFGELMMGDDYLDYSFLLRELKGIGDEVNKDLLKPVLVAVEGSEQFFAAGWNKSQEGMDLLLL